MADEKTFSVGVQTSSPKRISVTSNVSENPITATPDTGLYYSQLAKNWAIGEGLIENTDYASKAYAQESKAYALDSKVYSESASLDLENLNNKIIEYDEQLNDTVATGLSEISVLQANSIAEITTNKEAALSDITTAKTNALTNIETDLNNATNEIQNIANSSIEDINKTGLDTKVSKSGDTMTGNLTVEKNTNPVIYIKNSSQDRSVAASTDAGTQYLYLTDKNNAILGSVGIERYTNGKNTIKLQAFSADGSTAPAVRVNAYANNTIGCDFPKCTTKATTTSSARSDLVAVVVQNYVSGTSWYRVWSDGWVEQGFAVAEQTQAKTIPYNLLIKMANTNYSAIYTENAGNIGCHQTKLYKTSTTQVSVHTPSGGANNDGNVVVMGYKA